MRGARSAPRGTELTCRSWPQEAAMRMLMNNLDPDVAERPEDLVVYGGPDARRGRGRRTTRSSARSDARRRRDAARAVGQAGGRVPHAPHRAAGADLELDARPEVGGLGHVPRARAGRAHDVRADDRGLVDLHRDAGDPAGHVRDARRVRAPALRRLARRDGHAHRRARRDGRRAAARRDDERRRRALRRGRPRADRAADQDALPRPRDRRPRYRARVGRGGARDAARRSRSGCSATAPRWCPSSCAAAGGPTSSPIRRARTIRWAGTCRPG